MFSTTYLGFFVSLFVIVDAFSIFIILARCLMERRWAKNMFILFHAYKPREWGLISTMLCLCCTLKCRNPNFNSFKWSLSLYSHTMVTSSFSLSKKKDEDGNKTNHIDSFLIGTTFPFFWDKSFIYNWGKSFCTAVRRKSGLRTLNPNLTTTKKKMLPVLE